MTNHETLRRKESIQIAIDTLATTSRRISFVSNVVARQSFSNFTIRNMLHILCIFLLKRSMNECMSLAPTTFRNFFFLFREAQDVGRALFAFLYFSYLFRSLPLSSYKNHQKYFLYEISWGSVRVVLQE